MIPGYSEDPEVTRLHGRVIGCAPLRLQDGMRPFNFYSGVFCVTSATLMLQLIQTRMLSVVVWYHLAFFVISMAMLGLTAGASAPEDLVQGVIDACRTRFDVTLDTVKTARESVTFKLPRILAD